MRYLRLIRPGQWLKNAFVLAPLVFARALTDPARLAGAGLAFAVFCLLGSAAYALNDVIDRKADAAHPLKRRRPVASGELTARAALVLSVLLFLAGGALASALPPAARAAAAAFAGLHILYSAGLKRVVILDAVTIAVLFCLRVSGGAGAIGVEPSHWLLLCTFLLALFLAFGKRRHELAALGAAAEGHRSVLAHYGLTLLDQLIAVATGATVVTYALYTVSQRTREALGTTYLVFTVPLVCYGIFRYLYLIHARGKGGSPGRDLMTDLPLLLDVVAWAGLCAAIVYWRGA